MPILAAPQQAGTYRPPVQTPRPTAPAPGFANANAAPNINAAAQAGSIGAQYQAANNAQGYNTQSPGTQAAGALYGPQQQALDSQNQYYAGQQALAGMGLTQNNQYANQQYQNQMAGNALSAQGLGADRTYLGSVLGTTVGDYKNDIQYDTIKRAQAVQLYNAMMRGYATQQGPNGTIQQQLRQARGQASGQFANNSQQLAEQVGSQGAYGSKGAGVRQGFLQTTLNTALGGAGTQAEQQRAQLGQQIAQALATRQDAVALANRRQGNAQFGIQAANAAYQHGLAGNNISAAQLGVSSQGYHDALMNSIRNAGLSYLSANSGAANQIAQNGATQAQINQNQQTDTNTLNQNNYGAYGNYYPNQGFSSLPLP